MKENIFIAPDTPVVAGSWGLWKLIYIAGEDGIAENGALRISFHSSLLPVFNIRGDWSPFQADDPLAPGYITAQSSGGGKVELEMITPPKMFAMEASQVRSFLVVIKEGTLKPGEQIAITLGDKSFGSLGLQAQMIAERDMEIRVEVDRAGHRKWQPCANSPRLTVLGGKASQIQIQAPSLIEDGAELSLMVQYLDEFGHPAIGRAVEKFQIKNEQIVSAQGSPEPVELKKIDAGFMNIAIRSSDFPRKDHPVAVREESPELNLYWGDLHGHSNVSDGLRSPDCYFTYARDVSGLDFCALTDHEPGFSPQQDPMPVPADYDNPVWTLMKQDVAKYHDPGNFITFLGYEWTSRRYGHKCVYYLDQEQNVYPCFSPYSDTPEKLYGNLIPGKTMVITHHPGGGPAPAMLSEINPKWEPLIEIYSCHGTSDDPGVGRPLWRTDEGEGFYVQNALNAGYPFGIIAGSDTHTSDPGNPILDHPLSPHPWRVGIFAIYAEELTREALWDAFWKRRVYATTGERIFLDFQIDHQLMGSWVTADGTVTCALKIGGTTQIQEVEVIGNGKLLRKFAPEGAYLNTEFEIMDFDKGYVYVRVTQEDGEMAWSSPIWINSSIYYH